MGFDYSYTCPIIDGHITHIKQTLYDELEDIINDVCPLFVGEARDIFCTSGADSIYNALEDLFEGLRKCNQDMRSEADRQIAKLEEEVSTLRGDIDDLVSKVDCLEAEIAELEEELSEI